VCALHEHTAHTFRKLLKKFKSTNLISGVADKWAEISRGCKSLTGGGNASNR